MVKMQGMASLNIVKSEVDVTIGSAEAALRRFIERTDEIDAMQQTNLLLEQLCGVFRVIRLDGAALLTMDMVVLCSEIKGRFQDNESLAEPLECLGCSLLVLSHYLEFIYIKQYNLPVLLVPTVNQIRRFLSLPLVNEYDFVSLDMPIMQLEETPVVDGVEAVALQDIPKLAKRLRHMFQVGLVGVVNDFNIKTSLRIMYRAVERLARLTGDVPIGQLWWISLGVLEALIDGDVDLNSSRKLVLSKIDRQIKRLVYEGIVYLNELMPLTLLRECLYIVALSQYRGLYVPSIKQSFGVTDMYMSDTQLRKLTAEMNGPKGSVIFTVVDNLREEIIQIKEDLEIISSSKQIDAQALQQMVGSLDKMASTLSILGIPQAGIEMKAMAQKCCRWIAGDVSVSSDVLHEMAHCLLSVEEAITNYNAKFSQCLVETASLPSSSGTLQSSLKLMGETDLVVLEECRAGIVVAQEAIILYMNSNWDVRYLSDLPKSLHSVWGGLFFLQFERAAAILNRCEQYVASLLSGEPIKIDGADEPPVESTYNPVDKVSLRKDTLLDEEKRLGRVLGRLGEEGSEESLAQEVFMQTVTGESAGQSVVEQTTAAGSQGREEPSSSALKIHAIETLADAFCSVDFYLESIQIKKPIGAAVLQVAEESLQELGFEATYPSKVA